MPAEATSVSQAGQKPLRVFIAGHRGMVGQALHQEFASSSQYQLITADRTTLDLTRQTDVENFLQQQRPDWILVAAARVGGIAANRQYPADFLLQNLQIATNILAAAHQSGVSRVLYLGSSCIYPKFAPQPINETDLLGGVLEPTNEAYAVAKIAGLKLCSSFHRQYGCDFRALMPTNLYGPGDNFDIQQAHVVPALMRRMQLARDSQRSLQIWGSGQALREFLHVEDLARACRLVVELSAAEYWRACADTPGFLNVGSGEEISIGALAELLCGIIGYTQPLGFDLTKPDGTPRKLLDSSRLRQLGWTPQISLRQGLTQTWHWYEQHQQQLRGAASSSR
ncbi:GDP-L-fucose synthase [Rheinheimera texasensis]|uniref:GDP-L-fucose synthase family protein n=1 Tax=Rheinheimera texasensis TaxID=306205 RepID=UPI0032B222C9